ncbi:MAG: TIM-barrel domain-containing protein [Flavobacteriales bacterium]
MSLLHHSTRRCALLIASGGVAAGLWAQAPGASSSAGDFTDRLGDHSIHIRSLPFRFTLRDERRDLVLLQTKGGITLTHRTGTGMKYRKPYTVFQPGDVVSEVELDRITGIERGDSLTTFHLGNAGSAHIASLAYRTFPDGRVSLAVQEHRPPPADGDRICQVSIRFASDSTDSYLGMGMRFNATDHRGTIVTNWAQEVGPNLPKVVRNGGEQGRDITYAPAPFFLNLKGYGLLLGGTSYSVFDLGRTDRTTMAVTNHADQLQLMVYLSGSPLDIVSAYFRSNGAYTLPRPWVFGVWTAAGSDWQSKQKGQDLNESVLRTCRSNGIPMSAIWAEDWYFDFFSLSPIADWRVNPKYYPDYGRMIDEQHRSGVKHMGYFLPSVARNKLFKRNPAFTEGDRRKLFIMNGKGRTDVFKFFVWPSAQFDWTDTAAVNWFHHEYYDHAARFGVDGWLNDFGEYTSYGSRSDNGEWGTTMHNQYPLLWARTANDFFRKARPDGDHCVFSRSGWPGLHQYNAFLFTGDRNATYEPFSGLGGSITGVLNACLSVHPNTTMDIGAYNCKGGPPMGKLMMFRWIEMGALMPVMRLHRGVQFCDHWRFDEDGETLLQWKKYATLHARLFPYIYTLARQAADLGRPLVRHLALHHPDDPESLRQDREFLLGDRILSCPVTEEKADVGRTDMSQARTTWRVYLPPGNWYHHWSGTKYAGGAYHEVPAPPGSLPLFMREGLIIPTFDREVDTFVEGVEDPAIKDMEHVNASLEIRFHGYGEDSFTLWDGTTIRCSRAPGEAGTYAVENGHGRSYTCVFVD